MARVAVSTEEKFNKAVAGELTASEQAYFDWIVENATEAGVKVELDVTTFKLARGLYNDYIADPAVAAANAERKAQRDAEKIEREKKALDRAMELLKRKGFSVVESDESDDDEDDDA